jgi:hypothetical protein
MAAGMAIALSLASLAWTASAGAADNPACTQYHDALSYNLCLASHGPKAKSLGKPSTQLGPHGATRGWAGYGRQTRTPADHHRGPVRRGHGRMHMELQVR